MSASAIHEFPPAIPASPAVPEKIGLLAGWGKFPLIVARELRGAGYEVYCVGIKNHADRSLADLCHGYRELGGLKMGAALRYFRGHGVTCATMAGKVHKVQLLQRFGWVAHFPDWRCLRAFAPHYVFRTRDCRDDSLLNTLINLYAEDGITFAPATNFAPELLVKPGHLAGPPLTDMQRKDVEFGWQVAKELGRLDVGQSVAVLTQTVLALEAIEGTDECIRRAGSLCRLGGFTVVKVAKPQQDMRFDVPTVGVGTLETLRSSGGRVLAIEAGKTIVLDEPEVIAYAARHRLSVVALESGCA